MSPKIGIQHNWFGLISCENKMSKMVFLNFDNALKSVCRKSVKTKRILYLLLRFNSFIFSSRFLRTV